jgi:hypothetical protein
MASLIIYEIDFNLSLLQLLRNTMLFFFENSLDAICCSILSALAQQICEIFFCVGIAVLYNLHLIKIINHSLSPYFNTQ